jgi:hypothetical protein
MSSSTFASGGVDFGAVFGVNLGGSFGAALDCRVRANRHTDSETNFVIDICETFRMNFVFGAIRTDLYLVRVIRGRRFCGTASGALLR